MSILNLNKEMFDKIVMEEGRLILIDYWAPWCGYCRRISPALDKIKEQYGDRIQIAKVNIDEAPELARQENIEVIPTMVVYKDGKLQGDIVAPDSKVKIEEFLQGYLR